MNKSLHVDICVIGAGSGGLSVAAGAAQLGLDVALIEKGEMGGDCLNTGCVPSKALLAAAKAAQNFRKSKKFGITQQDPNVDFSGVKDHVFNVIGKIEPHDSQERFEGLGVKVFRDHGEFTGNKTLKAGDQEITARYFVIATGSRAAVPPIEGLEPDKVLTNENIFELREKPQHLIIIGGGPIGVEMAQAHRRLGCEVTILDMGSILPNDDPELVDVVRTSLKAEGVEIAESVKVEKINHADEGSVEVTIEKDGKKEIISGSHLLIAAGRKVNVDGLGLEQAGVEYDRRGIKTDERLRTSQKHIFAAGDVAGGPQFTHVAGYHAGIIIKNIIFKIPAKVDFKALPWVTYSDPELANVGMTEDMAREKHGDKIKVTKWTFKENDRALAENRTEGLIKVITDKKGKILGAGIAGLHAGELISTWGLAISQGLKIGALTNTIIAYPTLSEISKRAAGAYYTPSLFSDRTRKLVTFLRKLPF
ncbi:MAG: dihydrolipoamide dehydrogenase [Micavibrio sp.]|nr:MAG: dihydrolipoamide dehydrogenase [Micavibrio sp.]